MTERVGRGNLVEANAKIGVSDSAAQLVGPGIAGALIQWLTRRSQYCSMRCRSCFRRGFCAASRAAPNDAPKMRASSIGAEIREGLSAIWRNAVLRALAWAISVWQISGMPRWRSWCCTRRASSLQRRACGARGCSPACGSLGATAAVDA